MNFLAICLTAVNLLCSSRISNCYATAYDGKIAGHRYSSECLRGGPASKSDDDLTSVEKIKKEGYQVEEHVVLTEDGYLLTLHRIPGKQNSEPVFLQHGILTSSYDWLVPGKGKALAFILSDRGYDVWLGNARGNFYSQCHTKYNKFSSEFWDFSFHEMGFYDLPAVITYITDITNQKIFYIGHSMGATISFIVASERPDVASKVKVFLNLAPVVYRTHEIGLSKISDQLLPSMESYVKTNGHFGIYMTNFIKKIIKEYCSDTASQRLLCAELAYPAIGYDRKLFNDKYLPAIAYHYLSGTSFKTPIHFAQIRVNDRFQHYDYGRAENLRRYKSTKPPEYNISKIQAPVALFWSSNDYFTNPIDVKRLSDQIPNLILNHEIEYKSFNHWDYLYVDSAYKYVYSKILSVMEKYGKN